MTDTPVTDSYLATVELADAILATRLDAASWTAAMLTVTIVFMITAIAIQFVLPQVAAESLAEPIAPQLRVDEDRLRKILASELSKGVERRILLIALPFVSLVGFLSIRLIAEWQEAEWKGRTATTGEVMAGENPSQKGGAR